MIIGLWAAGERLHGVDGEQWLALQSAFFTRNRTTANKGKLKRRTRAPNHVVKKRLSTHCVFRALDNGLRQIRGCGVAEFKPGEAFEQAVPLLQRPTLVM